MALHDTLTPEQAAAELAVLGVHVAPDGVALLRRDEKWLARLPGERMAWFAATEAGRAGMERERRVLRVLEARCRFAAPRVLAEAADGDVDVRAMVPGAHDTFAAFHRVRDEPEAAAQVGAALGAVLAELHTRVRAEDVAAWLPRVPAWPEPRAWIAERLPAVVDDPALHVRADAIIARYEETLAETADDERVLVHTDLGFHNASIDPVSLRLHGVFDWETACWADRHLDFRYLLFDTDHFGLLDAARAVYEPATGRRIRRERVFLLNAASAIGFLSYRAGVPPEQVWCGRTLAEDLAWTRHAIARAEAHPENP